MEDIDSSSIVKIIADDDLAMHKARASAAKVLT